MKTIVAAIIVYVVSTIPTIAHDAPKGWSYDAGCCSGLDCREIGGPTSNKDLKVNEVPGGFQISTTSEIIPWNSPKIRQSKDDGYHWCSTGAGSDTGNTICLYVPDRGY